MSQRSAGPELLRLIDLIAKLPGLGPRSARRVALHLLKRNDTLLKPLAEALAEAGAKIQKCQVCGNFDTVQPCAVCQMPGRDDGILCVVEDVPDLWALERGDAFRGAIMFWAGPCPPLTGSGRRTLALQALWPGSRRAECAGDPRPQCNSGWSDHGALCGRPSGRERR